MTELDEQLSVPMLLAAYRAGYFPMGVEGGEIGWFSPDPRGILPLEAFHLPTRLRRVLRSGRFRVTVDQEFRGVMRACAANRPEGTWITDAILDAYCALHARALAHSVEVWLGDDLAGGLYGVSLGGAFFGESMFHRVSDASKVALAFLLTRLVERRYRLLDIQWTTPLLETFGAIEVARDDYMARLARALDESCRFDDA